MGGVVDDATRPLDPLSADVPAHVARGDADAVPAAGPALARSRAIFGQTVDVSNRLGSLQAPGASAAYPANSDLSRRLQLAATLLSLGEES